MNLHKVAVGVITAVNPNLPITITPSAGYTTNSSGKRIPQYGAPIVGASAQVQDLTGSDLRTLDRLNISGYNRGIYINGSIDAINRLAQHGGDLIMLPDGTQYLTTHVLERWPDWCRVSATLQVPIV
jgi:hypothetical protein